MRERTRFGNTGIVDANDPAVFLSKSSPSPEGHQLTEQLDQHTGAPVPFWMFSEAMVKLRWALEWIVSRDKTEGALRRHVRAALLALAGNLVLLGGYAVHRLEANGAAQAHAADQAAAFIEYRESVRREMDDLRHQLSELRADLRRLSGADPVKPNSDIDYNPDPDKLSELDRWNGILASMLPKPRPKSACGSICSSNIECSSGILKPCPFCNFGVCKSTRPELPAPAPPTPPPDAGIDAP